MKHIDLHLFAVVNVTRQASRWKLGKGRPVKYVLFVCNHNAGRSQMAQAFFERDAPPDVRAESAGTRPARAVWPEVVQVMAEIGIDLSGRKPRKLLREMQLRADWAVTMGCGDACPYVPTTVEAWAIEDPAGRPLEEVRTIRDTVEQQVRELIDRRLDEIRSDHTAHQLRLQALLPDLARDFEATHTAEEIRACADAVLTRYDDVPIRSHVQALAYRQTRDCLRREHCDALAPA
jgi:arsenate reductase